MKRYTSSFTYDLIGNNDFQFFEIRIPTVLDVVDQVGHFYCVELLEGQYVLLANHYTANKTSDHSAFGNRGGRKYWESTYDSMLPLYDEGVDMLSYLLLSADIFFTILLFHHRNCRIFHYPY